MIESPVNRAWQLPAAVRPYLAPVLRHVGWFGFFLVLAPVVGPHGYGLFMLALSAIALVEALLVETASAALEGADKSIEDHSHCSAIADNTEICWPKLSRRQQLHRRAARLLSAAQGAVRRTAAHL
jgi:hypothetical protein